MSRILLYVHNLNCSLAFLFTWGERLMLNFSIRVGSGIGPETLAPVLLAVVTISPADTSSRR